MYSPSYTKIEVCITDISAGFYTVATSGDVTALPGTVKILAVVRGACRVIILQHLELNVNVTRGLNLQHNQRRLCHSLLQGRDVPRYTEVISNFPVVVQANHSAFPS